MEERNGIHSESWCFLSSNRRGNEDGTDCGWFYVGAIRCAGAVGFCSIGLDRRKAGGEMALNYIALYLLAIVALVEYLG